MSVVRFQQYSCDNGVPATVYFSDYNCRSPISYSPADRAHRMCDGRVIGHCLARTGDAIVAQSTPYLFKFPDTMYYQYPASVAVNDYVFVEIFSDSSCSTLSSMEFDIVDRCYPDSRDQGMQYSKIAVGNGVWSYNSSQSSACAGPMLESFGGRLGQCTAIVTNGRTSFVKVSRVPRGPLTTATYSSYIGIPRMVGDLMVKMPFRVIGQCQSNKISGSSRMRCVQGMYVYIIYVTIVILMSI